MPARSAWLAPGLLVMVFVSLTLAIWWPSNFVRLSSFAIGEQFEAYHAALNIERFGWRWAGLQDEATSPNAASHPYLYTHHPNNGIYFSYLLRQLGVTSLPLQNAMSIFASAGGLLIAFLCLRKLTGSIAFATVAMALLALDYEFIRDWSVNIHRGLTYLSIFAAVYAFNEARRRYFRHWGWTAVALVACLNVMGTDYLFFVFTGSLIIAWIVLDTTTSWRARIWHIAATSAIFILAFVLRQVQVAIGLGWEGFMQDFVFQAVNRLHLDFLVPDDWSERAAEFYASNQVFHTGFTEKFDPWEMLRRFANDSGSTLLSNVLGVVKLGSTASLDAIKIFGVTWTAVVLLELLNWRLEAQRLSLVAAIGALSVMVGGIAANLNYSFDVSIKVAGTFAAVCAIAVYRSRSWPAEVPVDDRKTRLSIVFGVSTLLGCFGLMLFLPGYFRGWYRQFQLDSICLGIWMTAMVIPYLRSAALAKHWKVAVAIAVVIKAVSLGTQLLPLPPPGGDHTQALLRMRGIPAVTNFTPASLASYTHAFAGMIKTTGARKLLAGEAVTPDDYWMLFERDRANPLYERPPYFVYFKGLVIFVYDWSFLSEFQPAFEGNDYAVYSVPSPRRK